MRTLTQSDIPTAFKAAGKSLYLVGGSVRDTIMGRAPKDYDYTTNATPSEIRWILEGMNPDALFAVGEKFGTIGAIFDGAPVEITTFRTETYEGGSRKPDVTFGTDLVEDLSRRDFTINAIAKDMRDGFVVDPFAGRTDIRDGIIRAVGKPAVRFSEDPLRLLRAVRFACQFDFTIEMRTLEAMRKYAYKLKSISQERIVAEMNKILMSDYPGMGIRLLIETGLMDYILPEFMAVFNMPRSNRYKNVYEHTLLVVKNTRKNLAMRWAALLHDIAKPLTIETKGEVHFINHDIVGGQLAERICNRLRMDNTLKAAIVQRVTQHMYVNGYSSTWTNGAVKRFMLNVGDAVDDLIELSRADLTTRNQAKRDRILSGIAELESRVQRIREEAEIVPIVSPLNGNDLMDLFQRKAGAWIQPIKQALLDAVIDGTLDATDIEGAKRFALALAGE